jgi:zinc protease
MFMIDASPVEGKTVAELESAIRSELQKVQQEGISEAELKRVKAQVIAADVYQRDSLFFQAMQLGKYAKVGLPIEALDGWVDKMRAVTAEQVQAVARKWLQDDRLNLAELDPQPMNSQPRQGAATEVSHAH